MGEAGRTAGSGKHARGGRLARRAWLPRVASITTFRVRDDGPPLYHAPLRQTLRQFGRPSSVSNGLFSSLVLDKGAGEARLVEYKRLAVEEIGGLEGPLAPPPRRLELNVCSMFRLEAS